MQIEIKEHQALLSRQGRLINPGWARHPYWDYDRDMIYSGAYRIKEWDYYAITNFEKEWNICITYSDLGYAGLFSLTYLDYRRGRYSTTTSTRLLTRHKTGLGNSSEEDSYLTFSDKRLSISMVQKNGVRRIIATAPRMELPDGSMSLKVDLKVSKNEDESMNIATSWSENRHCFYYNEKQLALKVEGFIERNLERETLAPDSSLALLDWGRGRWYRRSTWFWSAIMGYDKKGRRFGINTGYGFSDRSLATENAIIYDGVVHKLDQVKFTYPENYTSDLWSIKDNEGRLELVMTPIVNRADRTDFKIIISDQNQVFGRIRGFFILDDGEKIEVDTYGFAERVYNKW